MIKRLSGGLILLCFTSISLGVTSGEVTITDADVLEQLKELRQFIDVNRDFTKGFKNLKPVLVEYRSSASKFNGIALGNLSFNTDALHMSIGINTIQADGKMLVVTINVVYAWSDYIGYQVSSAKLTAYETLATGDGTFTGDVGVGGDLAVTGDASVGGDLVVTGSINGEENPSVKPIYCHPISLTRSGANGHMRLTCLIFNNSATPFTLTTFKDFIDGLVDAIGNCRIMVSGGLQDLENNKYIISASYIAGYTQDDEIEYNVAGIKDAGAYEEIYGTWEDVFHDVNLVDAVNKIN